MQEQGALLIPITESRYPQSQHQEIHNHKDSNIKHDQLWNNNNNNDNRIQSIKLDKLSLNLFIHDIIEFITLHGKAAGRILHFYSLELEKYNHNHLTLFIKSHELFSKINNKDKSKIIEYLQKNKINGSALIKMNRKKFNDNINQFFNDKTKRLTNSSNKLWTQIQKFCVNDDYNNNNNFSNENIRLVMERFGNFNESENIIMDNISVTSIDRQLIRLTKRRRRRRRRTNNNKLKVGNTVQYQHFGLTPYSIVQMKIRSKTY